MTWLDFPERMIYWFALVCTFSDTEAATEVTVDGLRQSFNFYNVWAWDLTFFSSCMSKPKLGSEVETGRDIRKIKVFILGSGSGAATRLLIKGHLHLLFWCFFFQSWPLPELYLCSSFWSCFVQTLSMRTLSSE